MATCKSVLSHCYLGDWFVLYQLSKNSNSYFFRYLLKLMDTSFTSQVDGYLSTVKSLLDIFNAIFFTGKVQIFQCGKIKYSKEWRGTQKEEANIEWSQRGR